MSKGKTGMVWPSCISKTGMEESTMSEVEMDPLLEMVHQLTLALVHDEQPHWISSLIFFFYNQQLQRWWLQMSDHFLVLAHAVEVPGL